MRTALRRPVGQNGSSFTSASTSEASAASTSQSPPAPWPSPLCNGPAAITFAACFSRNARWAAMCWRRTSVPAAGLSSNSTTNFMGASLPVGLAHLRLDLGHARYPAVVILGLLAHVAEHLWMGQDHEGLLLEAGEHVPCDLLG